MLTAMVSWSFVCKLHPSGQIVKDWTVASLLVWNPTSPSIELQWLIGWVDEEETIPSWAGPPHELRPPC
jgi:hypothetical protein